MKIAVEGCAHGELEKIYDTISYLEEKEGVKVDLLICCGDFQSTRNDQDLECMAVPPKYRDICSFYKYYSGEKTAPILTIFIGGNHEASNYLSELAYGGWVAPNIYYLGYAGVIQVAGIRIAGLSGIFKGYNFKLGHFEKAPFSGETMRSVYHIRNLEVFRLKQISGRLDIALSHDWPTGVCHHGNMKQLLRFKPFFEEDIRNNTLGSPPAEELLHHLKPSYWFSAHLHCKFSALIRHITEDESNIMSTKFLSLDKCLPRRRFLQIVDIPHDESKEIALEYDLEWLSILSLTNHLLSVKQTQNYMPGPGGNGRWIFTPTTEEMDFVLKKFSTNLKIPMNFIPTVEAYDPSRSSGNKHGQPKAQLNPQTTSLCDLLGIDDPIALLLKDEGISTTTEPSLQSSKTLPEVVDIGCDKSDIAEAVSSKPTLHGMKLPPPKLSGLVLPPPMHKEEEVSPNDCTDKSEIVQEGENHSLEPTAENPIIESRTPAFSDVENSGQGPLAKKFKRRNQSLYSSTEDDLS
ncbi:Lariat debranching enzyme [Frankliniella fusca]|uniref:Lariat debranching enzyme n=1 Tax=Frankliniella fusca TaxID=407009 RepID=A0AAE1LTV7_9NEOP|nr:Lariat debranching enzyme [Frankliniella fusca]